VIPGAEAPSHPLFIFGSSYCPIRRDEELEGGKDVMMVDNESVMVVAVAVPVVLTL